jgi:hypothetical protein
VATTTAPARGTQERERGPAAAGSAASGPAAPAATGTPSPDADTGAPVVSTGPAETRTSLLAAPDYDNIVGGVPPSPFASLILLGGIICLVASAAGTAAGADMTQWWILGAMLVAVAVFLAGFVSRG